MTDLATPEATIEPITASADGKRNCYTLGCTPTGQSMNYAACLWRQEVLGAPNVKTPADWAACSTARNNNTCTAMQMRQEEVLAGRAIYFEDRSLIRKITDAARRWITPVFNGGGAGLNTAPTKVFGGARAGGKSHFSGKSMLDAMGDAGSFSDAITAAAKTPAEAAPARVIPIAPLPVAHAGESPLQMARRIAAERAASAN